MESLVDTAKKRLLVKTLFDRAEQAQGRMKTRQVKEVTPAASSVPPAQKIPAVEGFGVRVVKEMPLQSVFQYLAKRELFRLSWGAKNKQGAEWEQIQADFEARLGRMQKEALSENWLQPQGVYGYFPCQSEGNDLLIYQPEAWQKGREGSRRDLFLPAPAGWRPPLPGGLFCIRRERQNGRMRLPGGHGGAGCHGSF